MDRDALLRFAERVRELMARAPSEAIKEQLRLWVEEFEAKAAQLVEPAADDS